MAATLLPYGFRPVGLLGSQSFVGATRLMKIASGYATSIFQGDPVEIINDGTINLENGTSALTPAGIFWGVTYTDPSLGYKLFRNYWPASTVAADAYAYVIDDPDAIFQIQANGTVAQTAIGSNIALATYVAGSAGTGGQSRVRADAATVNTTNTLPLRIIDFSQAPEDSVGDAFTNIIVKWNFGMHQYENATGI